jgi:isopentenyl-diphosphate delta-isomerase
MTMQEERIVFVDEQGKPTGETGPKLASHTADTKLHLAFSCYIFHADTRLFLLTQRAHVKKVWPDVWTNSACGHPMPGETVEAAIHRRSKYELGLDTIQEITLVLPTYRYKTPPYNGIIENEFCPVYVAFVSAEPCPNPDEVEAYRWISWEDYGKLLREEADSMSYWAKDQYPLLVPHIEKLLGDRK